MGYDEKDILGGFREDDLPPSPKQIGGMAALGHFALGKLCNEFLSSGRAASF